jgi:RHS repeat-associated protein
VYIFSGTKVIAEYTPSAATTAPTKEYIYSGAQLLATLDASHNPTYRQSDHLSARLLTDATGNVVGTQGHLPFGEGWYLTGIVDKWKFTSYERDSDTNLDYAIMRFDSARLARFMLPDPYDHSADPSDPQSWNRYTYVLNNPIGFIDPLGLSCSDPDDGKPCVVTTVDVTAPAPDPVSDNFFPTIYQPNWARLVPIGDHYVRLPVLPNIPTISAGSQSAKEDYCKKKSDQAALNVILPGLGDVIYNYDNVDVAQKLTSGVLETFFGFGTGAGQAMSWTTKSDMALTNIRSATGLPKTLVGLKVAGGVATAVSAIKAVEKARETYKACMALMASD